VDGISALCLFSTLLDVSYITGYLNTCTKRYHLEQVDDNTNVSRHQDRQLQINIMSAMDDHSQFLKLAYKILEMFKLKRQ